MWLWWKKKKGFTPPPKKISKNSHWGNFYWFDSSRPRLPVVTVKVLEYDYSAPIAVDAATTAVFILFLFILFFFFSFFTIILVVAVLS